VAEDELQDDQEGRQHAGAEEGLTPADGKIGQARAAGLGQGDTGGCEAEQGGDAAPQEADVPAVAADAAAEAVDAEPGQERCDEQHKAAARYELVAEGELAEIHWPPPKVVCSGPARTLTQIRSLRTD